MLESGMIIGQPDGANQVSAQVFNHTLFQRPTEGCYCGCLTFYPALRIEFFGGKRVQLWDASKLAIGLQRGYRPSYYLGKNFL